MIDDAKSSAEDLSKWLKLMNIKTRLNKEVKNALQLIEGYNAAFNEYNSVQGPPSQSKPLYDKYNKSANDFVTYRTRIIDIKHELEKEYFGSSGGFNAVGRALDVEAAKVEPRPSSYALATATPTTHFTDEKQRFISNIEIDGRIISQTHIVHKPDGLSTDTLSEHYISMERMNQNL